MLYGSRFDTDYGPGVVYASAHGIIKVEIPDLSRHDSAQLVAIPELESSKFTVQTARMLHRYFHGERIDFIDVPVIIEDLTQFRKKILRATKNLKYGEICSYAQIARECDSPNAARAVGGALALNPIPIIIPCHRVVASNGNLTGFSAPGGENTKRALLKMEGVEFKGLMAVANSMVMHRTDV